MGIVVEVVQYLRIHGLVDKVGSFQLQISLILE